VSAQRTTVIADDDSYAPQIKVLVGNKTVPLEDVIDLKVTLQNDEVGGFTMQLANHFEVPDAREDSDPKERDEAKRFRRRFRHSDDMALDVFEPVTVEMGYEGRMARMFLGEITMLQPTFPSSGMPTFTVTGTDMLVRLRRSKPNEKQTKAFHQRADWEIAELVAKRHNLKYSKQSSRDGEKRPQTMQRDMDDLQFVLFLAKRNRYECTVILEDGKPALYFGEPRDKSNDGAVNQVRLAWGESLISFSPKLRVGKLVSKVTVRGWNARKKEVITYTATFKDIPKTGEKGKTAAEIIEQKIGAKEERIVDRPVQSREEAKKLAIELLSATANEFLTGSGETIGEPKIRPQTNLELVGLGKRYDGVYYVTKTEHSYGAGGYTTSFEVERMRQGDV
jgi:phage protein D